MNILVIAAHPDDEVLGCGGTLARWAAEGHDVHVLLLADGESARSATAHSASGTVLMEQRNCAARNARDILGCKSCELLALPDNRLDGMELLDIVRLIEATIERIRPQTLLTHHCGDVNIDHSVVHDAVVTACRPQPGHLVSELLFFEVPSSTEWRPAGSALPFQPNVFVDISGTLAIKHAALGAYSGEMRAFPHPRSHQAVEALARWRGASVGVDAAEAFMLGRKILPANRA